MCDQHLMWVFPWIKNDKSKSNYSLKDNNALHHLPQNQLKTPTLKALTNPSTISCHCHSGHLFSFSATSSHPFYALNSHLCHPFPPSPTIESPSPLIHPKHVLCNEKRQRYIVERKGEYQSMPRKLIQLKSVESETWKCICMCNPTTKFQFPHKENNHYLPDQSLLLN